MNHTKNNLSLVPAQDGLSLGQVLANFKHVAIGDVNAKNSEFSKLRPSAKQWAAIRATTREEDGLVGRYVRSSHNCQIVPANTNHTDIVFFFNKKGQWAVNKYKVATVASIQWCLNNNVFKPESADTMRVFLNQCNENPIT